MDPRFAQYICAFVAVMAVAGSAAAQQPFRNTLMPQPSHLSVLTGDLRITDQFRVRIDKPQDRLLRQAAERMISHIEQQTAIQLDDGVSDRAAVSIEVAVADHSVQRPAEGMDESYTLDIHDGIGRLDAETDFGAMRGMETILQLIETDDAGYWLPAVHISDAPRFPWRGLLLDPGRHFLPVSNILRTLDAMAAVKMNVLHLHLTDDQGFRVESKLFPKLQEMGSDGQYYTQKEILQIVRYATDRGIRIVPEFDMPAHSTTWLIGYPQLASRPGSYHVEHTFGIKDAAMDPTRESTYHFIDSFIGEMTTLFPDEYIHIGGDESNGKDWRSSPEIARFMRQHRMKSTNDLQAYFNSRIEKLLAKHGRRMIGWDEILQPGLSPAVAVQNWHGIEFLVESAREGHRGILSKPFYLDHHYSAEQMYAADPIPAGDALTPAQEKLILGGEACMWGEQVDLNTVDSRIWPRTAAVAERLWSASSVRDPEDMYRRLAVISLRLDALGITHISWPQRGLRDIAGGEPAALEVFASVVQPVDIHERSREEQISQSTPMTNLADFTVPDPLSRERFAEQVANYLRSVGEPDSPQHTANLAQLKQTFNGWLAAAGQLRLQSASDPRLAAIAVRREQWTELALLGLQAIDLIESKQRASDSWIASKQELIRLSAQPRELIDFVILEPLGDLLKSVSEPTSRPERANPM